MRKPLTSSPHRRRALRLNRSVFFSLLGVVLLLGLLKLSTPFATLRRQQRQLACLRLERAALLQEQNRLQQHQRHLATEAGQEQAARQKGYLRAGERRIVFVREHTRERTAQPDP